ncbi:MAG: hypothetical protein HY077_05760 [Elusimicrobia bacterium]|nr:hypothetical protein [Elusimicrobiota bacterium]
MSRSWVTGVAAALGLQLLGFLLYANTLNNEPVWDDHDAVFNQSFVQDCSNLRVLFDPRSLYRVLPVRNSARPGWLASVVGDACLYGRQTWGYHLTSLLWHGWGACCLVCLAWLLTKDRLAALVAGCLFVVHPIHTEAVNIISFRGDLLALFWSALSLILYVEARSRAGPGRAARVAGSLLCFGLGLLCKEMAVTLPLLVVLTDALLPARQAARRRPPWKIYAAYGALLLLYLAFRLPRSGYVSEGHEDLFSSLRRRAPAVVDAYAKPPPPTGRPENILETPPWSRDYFERPAVRALTMSRIAGSYLRLLAWPHPLQGDYAPRPVDSWTQPGVLASWIAWLLVFASAWRLRRRRPVVALGLLWIPATLLPVSGLVALHNLQAERYLYVPSAGLCLAAGAWVSSWLNSRSPRTRRLAGAATLTVVVLLSALTLRRNRDYRDDLSFFLATQALDDGIPRVHFNLAQAYAYKDEPDLAQAQYLTGLRLWPEALKGRLEFARFLLDRDRPAEALAQLETARRYHPDSARVSEALRGYQTRQALGRVRGLPAGQLKARANSGMLETTPLTR